MNRILFFTLVFATLVQSCAGDSAESHDNIDTLTSTNEDSGLVKCPYGHTDSIIPVIYGYPSEEEFQKSDSGLVALGGCSLPNDPASWFCKIHQITF
jgi:hypothetical protein